MYTKNDIYATISGSTDMIDSIEILGGNRSTLLSDVAVSMKWRSGDGTPLAMDIPFFDEAAAMEHVISQRNLLAKIANLDEPLPFRAEVAGLTADGEIDENITYLITENKGSKLPYRVQMYENGEPSPTYTDFRRAGEAMTDIMEQNCRRVSPVIATAVSKDGNIRWQLVEKQYANGDGAFAGYFSKKDENGNFHDFYRDYFFDAAAAEQLAYQAKADEHLSRFLAEQYEGGWNIISADLKLDEENQSLTLSCKLKSQQTGAVNFINMVCRWGEDISPEDFLQTHGYNTLRMTNEQMHDMFPKVADELAHSSEVFDFLADTFFAKTYKMYHINGATFDKLVKCDPSKQVYRDDASGKEQLRSPKAHPDVER